MAANADRVKTVGLEPCDLKKQPFLRKGGCPKARPPSSPKSALCIEGHVSKSKARMLRSVSDRTCHV